MKVVIIGGAGGVGSSAAFNLLLRGEPYDVVLVDLNPNIIASHVMDLEQTLVLGAARSVRGGAEHEVFDSDVVVVSASVPLRLNSSRLVFLNDNAAIVNRIGDLLAKAGPDWGGVLLIVTNPVDPLCTWAQRRTGLRSWYARHVALDSGRTSTWTSGLGVARMVASIAYGKGEMWPASVVLAGEYGIDGVSLSVPVSLGRRGVENIHEWEITPEERAALQVAAARVHEVTNTINVSSSV